VIVKLPPLETGDMLDQKTFHARYEAMPADTRAELIGGVVYMPSPMKNPHARMQRRVSVWLDEYQAATPGIEGGDGPTTILGAESEPQPDSCLYIPAAWGGQARINDEGYLEGAPELIAEIASATESIDLHFKKRDYEKAGVREYVVVALRQERVYWFVLREDRFVEQTPASGILRSEVFPGLWLDPNALLRHDRRRVHEVLQQGLVSPEHGAFVQRLSRARVGASE
jgi:Uma2 family endonuclease